MEFEPSSRTAAESIADIFIEIWRCVPQAARDATLKELQGLAGLNQLTGETAKVVSMLDAALTQQTVNPLVA